MARPTVVCGKCHIGMVMQKSGIRVIEMFSQPPEPYQIWRGDLFCCPVCGATVVTGFGAQPEAMHFQGSEFAHVLDVAQRDADTAKIFEHMGDSPEWKRRRGHDDIALPFAGNVVRVGAGLYTQTWLQADRQSVEYSIERNRGQFDGRARGRWTVMVEIDREGMLWDVDFKTLGDAVAAIGQEMTTGHYEKNPVLGWCYMPDDLGQEP